MKIDLTKDEVTEILKARFGSKKAVFRLFYEESDNQWEERNHKKISELQTPPDKLDFCLYFNDEG